MSIAQAGIAFAGKTQPQLGSIMLLENKSFNTPKGN
jgi:hypothetical protein